MNPEQMRPAEELRLLNEIASAIVRADLSVQGLCELIYEQSSRVVDTSTFHLGLFEGAYFTLWVFVREGERQPPLSVQLSPGEGIIGWMRQSKQPLLVHDFLQEMDQLPARPIYVSDYPSRSAIFVPLMARDEVIGSLSIQSPRPDAFTQEHLRILSFIAEQSSLAIEKARLYQAAQDRAVELERIAEENAALYEQVREERDRLELLYNVARELSQRLDTEGLLKRLLQQTVSSVRASEGTILLSGTRREPPRCISLWDECKPDDRSNLQDILTRGLAGWVIHKGQGALIPDVQQDERWLPVNWPVGSVVAVPIPRGGTAWGAITLTHPQVGFFTEADVTLLKAIADQAAIALETTCLYESQRRRAVQLETIAQVMRSILSILDLDSLLDDIVHLVRVRFGYAHVHLFTLDEAAEEAIFRASTDLENPFWVSMGGRLPLGEGLVGWTAQHGEPVVVGDVCQDERWLPDQKNVAAEVAVPLKVAGSVVGVLDVQSEERDAFDEEDQFVLQTLADLLAVALEQARLYTSQQEEAWVLNALLQVAQNIARVRGLDEMLEAVVRLVPLLVGVAHCALLLHERSSRTFQFVHGYGVGGGGLRGEQYRCDESPALEQVVRQAAPLALVGPKEQQKLPPALLEVLGQDGIWLFPLIVGGEVSGVLLLGLEAGAGYLSSRQHTILTGITHQAGIAIEEARLRQEAAARQRLEQELAMARDIQQRLLPEHPPQVPGWSIEVVWQSARQVGGDFYDFVQLPDGRLGVVIADVSDKGMPAALIMTLSRSLMQASAISHISPAEALARTNYLLLRDTQGEMFVSIFYAIINPESGQMFFASAGHNPPFLCRANGGEMIPLEAQGIVLGVVEDPVLEDEVVNLEIGDTLVLYTDGVTEAVNASQEEFGEQRLCQIVCGLRTEDLGAVRRAVLASLHEFSQGLPPFDDITLVLLRRDP